MQYGEIVSINHDRGFCFIVVNDPTSEYYGKRIFLHSNSVLDESEVQFLDARVHDLVAMDLEDAPRGPAGVAAYITKRPEGERVSGKIVSISEKGFAFVKIGDNELFCHISECDWELTKADVGVTVTCELQQEPGKRDACIKVMRVD